MGIRDRRGSKATLIEHKLRVFMARGWLSRDDSVLAVCGNAFDNKALRSLGFRRRVISSLSVESGTSTFVCCDAQRLCFPDASFDHVMVHAGLHHCASPHRALCEMYRVARKSVILFEAQDSVLVRLFARFGLAQDYELDAVKAHGYAAGGVDNGPAPNYIYRWTRREIEKTIRSLDPAHDATIAFEREFHLYPCLLNGYLKEHPLLRLLGAAGEFLIPAGVAFLNLFFRFQGNHLVACIRKEAAPILPWLEMTGDGFAMKR